MGKKPKLKVIAQKAIKAKKDQLLEKALAMDAKKGLKESKQHVPENMTLRHSWDDGLETEIPLRSDVENVVLVIGDGNLSYSCALARLGYSVLATTFDSRKDLIEKYGDLVEGHLKILSDLNVPVIHEVDGTKLHLPKTFGPIKKFIGERPIGRIIFNYPHTGAGIKDRDRNIRAQQELVKNFLVSSCSILQAQKSSSYKAGLKLISRSSISRSISAPLDLLKKKKKKMEDDSEDEEKEENTNNYMLIPEIHLTVRTGDPYDDWKVKHLGNSIAVMRCIESFRFEPDKYEGYTHAKTIGDVHFLNNDGEETDFLRKPARTYVFRLVNEAKNKIEYH